ncbi:hypothetical protein J1TS3_30850 [Siminovitchia fordii]|uniref:Transposase n=1 Tax=Siminovitchia fordii TaxID=254759 RepID=A0ABQ4KAC6_9BACI|nr:hypothetical protein J1TS3_30850 [Siminovitchia fordii]
MGIGNFGVYVDTVGRNKKVIEEYIQKQIQEDRGRITIKYGEIQRSVYW